MNQSKACTYKRFNVGQYMKEKRLGWLEIQKKNKKVNATRKKLERMDNKVENISLFYLLETLIYSVDFTLSDLNFCVAL